VIPVLLAVAASTPRERVAVVAFLDGGDARSPSLVHRAVADAIRLRPTLELVSTEELFVGDPDRDERIEDCGTDAACLSDRLAPYSARYGLLVVVGFGADPPIVGLRLVDTRERRIVESLSIATPDPMAELRALASGLFDRAGHAQWAILVVQTAPPAVIHVDGVATPPALGSELVIPPGRYRVGASLPGHRDEAREVDVAAGARVEVSIAMQALPEPEVWETWWFWTIIGGAAVAAGTTAAVIVATRKEEVCVGNSMALERCGE
jgi:hypothetical protein